MQRPDHRGCLPSSAREPLTSAGLCEEVLSCMFAFVRCGPGERPRLTQVGHDIELRVVKEKVEAHHGDIDVLKKSAEQNSRVIEDVQRWMYQSENKLAARS